MEAYEASSHNIYFFYSSTCITWKGSKEQRIFSCSKIQMIEASPPNKLL